MRTKEIAQPKIVYDDGKPSLVILNIADYQYLLERAEDTEDLKEINRLRKQKSSFRPFETFLNEQKSNL